MASIKKFEDLEVWQKAREICKYVEQLFETTKLGVNISLRNSEIKGQKFKKNE